jgi:predicted PurR-regulated permease PerM
MADHVANTDRRRGVDLGTVLAVIGTLLTVLGMCAGLAGWVFNYVGAIRDTTNQNTQSILYLQQTAGRLEQTQQQNQRDVRDDLHDINGKLDRLLTGSPADQSPSTKKWSRQ